MLPLRLLAVGVVAGVFAASTSGQGVTQPQVNEAIAGGVRYLTANPQDGGGNNIGQHDVGRAALIGLALLEGGVAKGDGTLGRLTAAVRGAAGGLNQTYDVALAITFLDRLGDAADVPAIQILGVKLLAGQNGSGGWGYATWGELPVGPAPQPPAAVPQRPGVVPPNQPPQPPAAPPEGGNLSPEARRLYDLVRAARARGVPFTGSDDTSNTQFAILGLWVAQRHGVPIRDAVRLFDARFLASQSPRDFGWGYSVGSESSPSMTCAGLLGLAVSTATFETKLVADKPAEAPGKGKGPDDVFDRPPDAPAGGDGEAKPPDLAAATRRTAAIQRGLFALGRVIRAAQAGLRGGAGVGGYGGVDDLYFYWSVERVGVVFSIDRIGGPGGVDWYQWGATNIVRGQGRDGSWGSPYGSAVGTAFAILFLSKANYFTDMTGKLKGKLEGAEMRGTRGGAEIAPIAAADGGPERGTGGRREGGDAPPALADARARNEADRIAADLVKAKDDDFRDKLRQALTAPGPQYTAGLLRAVLQLTGDRQQQARATLAGRLARMTPSTLKRMLEYRDPEVRRAAALAVGMRDEKSLIPDLVPRVADFDDAVVRAARASLKSLSGRDYGPESGASEEDKQKAADEWRLWYQTDGRGR